MTPEQLYDLVQYACSKGFHVPAWYEQGLEDKYMLFSPFMDDFGRYRTTGAKRTLHCAINDIGSCNGYEKDSFIYMAGLDGWKLHSDPFKIKYEDFKVGDVVKDKISGDSGKIIDIMNTGEFFAEVDVGNREVRLCYKKDILPWYKEEEVFYGIDPASDSGDCAVGCLMVRNGKKYEVKILREIN